MFNAIEQTAAFDLIEAISVALREEFRVGEAIEDQPALHDLAKAGQVNRTFRVVARCILRAIAPPDVDLAGLLSSVLHQLVRRRLTRHEFNQFQITFLLTLEQGRDDWLAFFLLTPQSEIDRLLRTEGPDSGRSGSAPPPA